MDAAGTPEDRVVPAGERVSSTLAAQMAAAADQGGESAIASPSDWRMIQECAELLSCFFEEPAAEPISANPDSGGSASSDNSGDDSRPSKTAFTAAGASAELPRCLGRFELRRAVGRGGFGVVFLVFDPRLQREAALKIPRPEIVISAALRQRFLREAQAAAVLDHPNIVPVYETGELGPLGYILSAYCKGPTLAGWLQEHPGGVPPRLAAEITGRLAQAVQHAHSRGILHRDIKPANVLLEPLAQSPSGAFPFVPRLSDFGLAKRLDVASDETQAGTILGTPRYMAPEQAAGRYREIGVHTDVYSLGVVLHELLTGEPAAASDADAESGSTAGHGDRSPAALRVKKTPRDLETICCKCLEGEPSGRYRSADDLAEDLRRFLAGEVVQARPVTASERFVRWCRRRPLTAALSLGLIAAIVLGTSTATWQWFRAEQHLVDARAEANRAEANLGQAEDTLLDLAWLVEESTLWDTRNKSVLGALHAKLDAYHRSVDEQRDDQSGPAPLMAAVYSFAARNAAASGDPQAADENYRRSLELWREIVARHADHAGYRRALSLCLLNYGRFVLESSPPEQADAIERVRAYLHHVADDESWRHWSLANFVQLALEYGDALDGVTRFNDSLGVYQLGLIASEELSRRQPDDPQYQYFVGQYRKLVALHRKRTRAEEQAIQLLTSAREALERAVAGAPDQWRYRYELATTLRAHGSLHRERHQAAEAVPLLESSVALYARLCEERPDDPAMFADLAQSLRQLAGTQLALAQTEPMLESFARCRQAWKRAWELDPNLSEMNLKLMAHACYDEGEQAMILKQHARARPALVDGIAAFSRASERGRTNSADDLDWAGCHVFLGFQQAAADELQAAIDSYQHAVDILSPRVARTNVDKRIHDLHRRSLARVTELQARLAERQRADES